MDLMAVTHMSTQMQNIFGSTHDPVDHVDVAVLLKIGTTRLNYI